MELIQKCEKDLIKLNQCKNIKERRKLMKQCDECLTDAVSEIAKNCLIGNLKLKNCELKNLKKYSKILKILSKRNSYEKRKKLIVQKGGFLQYLIPSALYLLEKFMAK